MPFIVVEVHGEQTVKNRWVRLEKIYWLARDALIQFQTRPRNSLVLRFLVSFKGQSGISRYWPTLNNEPVWKI